MTALLGHHIVQVPDDHPLKARENVFAFSLALTLAPLDQSNPGAQLYHFVGGFMEEPQYGGCHDDCRWGDDETASTTNQADMRRGQSRMTRVRRELPPSRSASRPARQTGRRIADARTLQSCPHRASTDAPQELQLLSPRSGLRGV